jgi:all-trans-retinol 13,14-reductase
MVQFLRFLGVTITTSRTFPARRRARSQEASAWPMPDFGPWPAADDHYHVIVIGAGIAGLSAAALLARQGRKVLVVEAHNKPGGFCSCWTREIERNGQHLRFCFDAGVQDFSGLGPRGPLHQLLTRLDATDRIAWQRVRHLYVKDGLRLEVPDDPAALVRELAALFPDEGQSIAAFFAEMAAIYRELYADIEDTGGVPMPPSTIAAALAWADGHPYAWRWMREPFGRMLDEFFVDARLKRFLAMLSEYVTDEPARLTVGDMAPLYGYHLEGGFYPSGGSQRLADLLCEIIAEQGSRVALRSRVKRILIEDGRAVGVETAARKICRAPLVIANGDVGAMLGELVGADRLTAEYANRLDGMRRGPSAVLLSAGLDLIPDLPARVFIEQDGLEFGIGNPSAIDPSLAPPGHAALTFLYLLHEDEIAQWQRKTPDYAGLKADYARRLLQATETALIPDLSRHLVHLEVAAPPTFNLFARTRNGAIYGAARGEWCPAMRSPIPGLLLVGAGTSTGAGIEAVVVSGMMAANLAEAPAEALARSRACRA